MHSDKPCCSTHAASMCCLLMYHYKVCTDPAYKQPMPFQLAIVWLAQHTCAPAWATPHHCLPAHIITVDINHQLLSCMSQRGVSCNKCYEDISHLHCMMSSEPAIVEVGAMKSQTGGKTHNAGLPQAVKQRTSQHQSRMNTVHACNST